MKIKLRLIASAVMLIIAFSVSSYGWSDTGHMAVAFVAYRNLTPQARARVDALVALNPRFNLWQASIPPNTSPANRRLMLFMIAATWADQIKSDGVHQADGTAGGNRPPNDGTAARNIGYMDMAMHKYWHFVDLPFSTDGTPVHNPDVPNARTMIPLFRGVLASNSPDPLKSYDLVWLLHLVGDVHQPLHCAARFTSVHPDGDDGGNGVKVAIGQNSKTLHSFWDGQLGTTSDPLVAMQVATGLPTPPANLVALLNADVWINESFTNARNTVYQAPIGAGAGPFTINAGYRNVANNLSHRRVALAGRRLAQILNTELR